MREIAFAGFLSLGIFKRITRRTSPTACRPAGACPADHTACRCSWAPAEGIACISVLQQFVAGGPCNHVGLEDSHMRLAQTMKPRRPVGSRIRTGEHAGAERASHTCMHDPCTTAAARLLRLIVEDLVVVRAELAKEQRRVPGVCHCEPSWQHLQRRQQTDSSAAQHASHVSNSRCAPCAQIHSHADPYVCKARL